MDGDAVAHVVTLNEDGSPRVTAAIVDQFPSKEHSVFLVQTPKVPSLPNKVLQGPIYGVGIFRDERKARTLAKRLAEA